MTLSGDFKKRGAALLHQQCWCWGYDVRRQNADGRANLLVELGFERVPPPDGVHGATTYRLRQSDGLTITLWGFGLCFGDDGGRNFRVAFRVLAASGRDGDARIGVRGQTFGQFSRGAAIGRMRARARLFRARFALDRQLRRTRRWSRGPRTSPRRARRVVARRRQTSRVGARKCGAQLARIGRAVGASRAAVVPRK